MRLSVKAALLVGGTLTGRLSRLHDVDGAPAPHVLAGAVRDPRTRCGCRGVSARAAQGPMAARRQGLRPRSSGSAAPWLGGSADAREAVPATREVSVALPRVVGQPAAAKEMVVVPSGRTQGLLHREAGMRPRARAAARAGDGLPADRSGVVLVRGLERVVQHDEGLLGAAVDGADAVQVGGLAGLSRGTGEHVAGVLLPVGCSRFSLHRSCSASGELSTSALREAMRRPCG